MDDVGVVVIGRNEGSRLGACLASVKADGVPVVYVDSGSTDGSPEVAGEQGAEVVHLSPEKPFTAARARNAGFAELRRRHAHCEFIQFVDGDCELTPDWLQTARRFLSGRPEFALICGALRERHPERSVYNRLCQLEWRAPEGEIQTSGGIFMIRAEAYEAVGGMNEALIAGEEPDLCVRLRQNGWRLQRLAHEMATHDAGMTRFYQWWTRAVRAGHAAAEGVALHGRSPERFKVKQVRSAMFWGLAAPLAFVCLSALGFVFAPLWLGSAFIAGAWLWQGLRIAKGRRQLGDTPREARLFAAFCLLAKLPESLGVLRWCVKRLRGGPSTLIEYK